MNGVLQGHSLKSLASQEVACFGFLIFLGALLSDEPNSYEPLLMYSPLTREPIKNAP